MTPQYLESVHLADHMKGTWGSQLGHTLRTATVTWGMQGLINADKTSHFTPSPSLAYVTMQPPPPKKTNSTLKLKPNAVIVGQAMVKQPITSHFYRTTIKLTITFSTS